MKNKKLMVYAYVCIILGGILGGMIIYAENNPKTQIHKTVVSLGFHLKK